jgi:transcriptional regulator with XRE-family HTH domain
MSPCLENVMAAQRIPNSLLRQLLVQANWTGEALARAVNMLGVEAGIPLRYHRSSVAHWLSGVRPRPPVPELVAEAFQRRLGRPVSVGETGLGHLADAQPESARLDRWWDMDAASRLMERSEAGAPSAGSLPGAVYSLARLCVPGWGELVGAGPVRLPTARPETRVERWQISSAARMIDLFSDADFAFGGGHTRLALAGYLATVIAQWLRCEATPSVRRELLTVASRLAYLCGFMHFDDELHGTAQHYYLTSLRLASEAGDATGYAVTLRALSNQARLLGHHREAVHLAEAAVRAVSGTASCQVRAFVLGHLAVAHAADGSRAEALRYLIAAERHLDRTLDAPAAIGGADPSSLAHQQAAVRAKLGDRLGAIEALTVSIRQRPAGERRSRAITQARLAELQLDGGDLEAACGTWQGFLQDYPCLRSRRVDTALAELRARVRPHQNTSAVIALHRQLASAGVSGRSSRPVLPSPSAALPG